MEKQWISTSGKEDSIVLSDTMLAFGKVLPEVEGKPLDHPIPERSRETIPLHYLNEIHIDFVDGNIQVIYLKKSETSIRCTNKTTLQEFREAILQVIPQAKVLSSGQSLRSLTRKPVAAMIAVLVIYLIVLISDFTSNSSANYSNSGSRENGKAMVLIIKGLASLGIGIYSLIFAALFLFAFYSYQKALKKRNKTVSIIVHPS